MLYSPGLKEELVITDSVFADNSATATNGVVYGGVISIEGYLTQTGANTVTLTATDGGTTLFQGNTVTDKNNGGASRTNSLFFGDTHFGTRNDMVLNASPKAGGLVALVDPVMASLKDGGSFTMNISGDKAGRFTWGGDNRLYSATAGLKTDVNFAANSTTELLAGYQLTGRDWATSPAASKSLINVTLGNNAAIIVGIADATKDQALFGSGTMVALATAGEKAAISAGYYEFTALPAAGLKQLILSDTTGGNIDALFTIADNDLFTTEFSGADSIVVVGSKVDTAMTSYGDNTTSAFLSGAMQEEWTAEKTNLGYDVSPGFAFSRAASLAKQSGDRADNYFGTFAGAMTAAGNIFHGVIALQNTSQDESWEGYQATVDAVNSGRALASPYVPCLRPSWRVWAGYVGSRTDQDSHGGRRGYDATYHGFATGVSRDFSDSFAGGLYYSYANGDTDQKGTSNEVDTDAHHVGAFLSLRSLDRRLATTLDFGFAWYDHDFSGRGASGQSVDQKLYTIGLETKYGFALSPNVTLSPFAAARWLHSRNDDIDEGLAAYNMDIDSDRANSFATRLGMEVAGRFDFGCVTFLPTVHAGWRHEWGDRGTSSRASYSPGGVGFGVDSVDADRDSLIAGAMLRFGVRHSERVSTQFYAGYDLTAGRRTTDHVWRVGVGVTF